MSEWTPPEKRPEPTIMEIDLNNYPGILNNAEAAQQLLKEHLTLLSNALTNGHHTKSQEVFKSSYVSILADITESMFDYKAILKHHPNKAEAEAMEILDLENNPLSLFTGYSTPFDFQGGKMTPKDFIGPYNSFKKWFQAQLYASRYLPYTDYVRFMYLGEFDMLESLKHANVEKLITIQPALSYQKKHNLSIGKFIEGTGFFDCGTIKENYWTTCPACQNELPNIEDLEVVYCLSCKAGFTK